MMKAHKMHAVGTLVIANDGFGVGRVGQVADHITDRWGTHHVVAIGGGFENVSHIGDADMLGIGWKVATDAEVARVRRYSDAA